ncbi:MAG: isopentenyl-diphosphate Delta-isomerase [Candidatus Aenigmarchaeota archaeon]|nr:isopentenyl-diphosphate Delta-isomerase [Candidatus Aenigmarchaeota archaeon]
MAEMLILVDKNDNPVGHETKERCHEPDSLLHRAHMVALFNGKGQLLITQRSLEKKLWPGYWDGSIASHVHDGETYEQAGERRLPDELGITARVKYIFKFHYKVPYKDIGGENEICAFLVGKIGGELRPDKEEIADHRFVDIRELENDMEASPEKYCPWLIIGLGKFLKEHGDVEKALEGL